jgi:hypothetical protein
MKNFVIVRNPVTRLLPRFIRVYLGEDYMGVDVDPFFTTDYREARIFPSYRWADSYVHDRDGRARPGMEQCLIRAVHDAHTIPIGGTDAAA